MEPSEFKFKAWNQDTQLMMRLDKIDCIKGSLHRKNHILLQYTGLTDKSGSEIYENDIILIDSHRFMIVWDEERNGWSKISDMHPEEKIAFLPQEIRISVKLCNYYESPDRFKMSP